MARVFLDIAGTPSVKAAQAANGVVVRSKLIDRRQRISGTLQKQHRYLHFKQMFGTVLRWVTGRM